MSRLMQKVGLHRFRNVGPLDQTPVQTNKVGIKLKQHLGAPCEPAVAVGDQVSIGQIVGQRPVTDGKPALGAPVHASIDGQVTAISDGVVWIEKS
jgi:Na+-translocating ferredoxin:NAD+ oxidoreductase RnfC subunit